jgi:hypothetical protein
MQVHLWVIDATGEVVGAGIFLLIMWLGIPAPTTSCRRLSRW